MIKLNLKKGINLYMINDNKFKSFRACVLLHRPLTKKEATYDTLLVSVMQRATKSYPTPTLLAEALENLYGASLIARATKYGENEVIKIGIKTITDKVKGAEGNFKNAIALLFDMLLNAGDGKSFQKSFVETEKKNIRDAVMSLKNDKRSYSVLRLQQEMFSTEPYGISPMDYTDFIDDIDAVTLYDHYRKVIEESRMDIIITGNFDTADAEKVIREYTLPLSERDDTIKEAIHKRSVSEVKEVTDKMDVTQGKLCMGFRSKMEFTPENYPAIVVFNTCFGQSPTSKLFNNVREKLSLCYYVTSSIDRLKEIMIVRSGVECDTFDKAYDEIMHQLNLMIQGDFDEKEITSAKKTLINAYESNYDSIASTEEYYTMQILLGTDVPISEMIEKIKAVTKEEITAVGKEMVLDTIYKLDKEAK